MKALIVSDAQQESMNIQVALEQLGYDTICYRWLLKALDNVEEIQPHVIIINAVDYPRHWKVMVQHCKCSLKNQPKVILLTPPDFEEDEAEKADILGVCGCITGIGQKHMDKLQQLLEERKDCQPTTHPSNEAKILFIHPYEETLYSGHLIHQHHDQYNMIPDKPIALKAGDIINDGSIKSEQGIKDIQAEVLETDPKLVLSLS